MNMDELLRLLKDGNTRTIEQLAAELHTTDADIRRQLEFLEHIGAIRRISAQESGCGHCGSCSGGACKGCMPENAKQNMGEIWEVIQR
jgi:hypothetical protein